MDNSDQSSIIYRLLNNPVFANILVVMLLLGGILGANLMVRESFPDFDFDIITVSVSYPGADPDEVEEGICSPLEDVLEGVSGVKRLYTVAAEGNGTAVIEISERADLREVKDDVKSQVDTIRTFPEASERPIITEIRGDRNVISLALWGEAPMDQIKDLARELKDELITIPGVSRVELQGARDYEVSIEVSEERLRQYGLSFGQVADAVSRSSLNLPGGTIRTATDELKLRIIGRKYRAAEFHDIVVLAQPNGATVRLGDIARLVDGFDEDSEQYSLFNGKPCVTLMVLKAKTEDSIDIAESVYKFAEDKAGALPPTLKLTPWFDMARLIQDRIDLLLRNGLTGLCLVFFILWLFMDFRLSFWVTAGVPVSIAGAMGIMYFTGQSLNMISLFAMILVLGILVDDGIVVGEAIYVHRQQGKSGPESAVAGVREVAWPVIMAVTTTMVAFIPLFFISGIMGKFIAVMPGPIVAALGISMIEALFILPVHLRDMPRPGSHHFARWYHWLNIMAVLRHWTELTTDWVIHSIYGKAMDWLLQLRYLTIAAAIAIMMIIIGLFQGGIAKFVFFPSSDDDYVHCVVELPTGTPLAVTEGVARQVIQAFNDTEIAYAKQLRGQALSRGQLALIGGTMQLAESPGQVGNQFLDVFVELLPAEERNIYYKDLLNTWRRKVGTIPGAVAVQYVGLGGGPPGGDIEVDLKGKDQEQLLAAHAELLTQLEGYDGVYDITSTYKPGKTELRVELKEAASHLGLSLRDLGNHLRQGYFGDEVMRVQRGRDEVKIRVRYPADERRGRGDLDELRLRTPTGAVVPFHQVAEVTEATGFATIRREEGQRLITVKAATAETANTAEIMDDLLLNVAPKLEERYQISARRGTESERQQESIKSMQIGAVFAMMGIFIIMASVFKSYIQPLIIMLTIPFGLIGAVIGHLIHDLPISIMSFFGMVALTGVVVNDAIVLIVAFNDRIAEGMGFFEALREAGKRRFRAIFLTSATTFGGLFPMLLEKSFQAQFLIPMALSLAYGVVFATLATLVLIPCLMVGLNDLRRLVHLAIHGVLPTRESLEPGSRPLADQE